MSIAAATIDCLKQHRLLLTTAESCTAGKIITLLSQVEGSGACIECGYVVYSEETKQRLLGVSAYTIKTFNLTSCEVAREMAQGALRDSPAQVAVATTGLLGPDSIDGIPPGTVCVAGAYHLNGAVKVFSRKERFIGSREQVQVLAAEYALKGVARFLDEAVGR